MKQHEDRRNWLDSQMTVKVVQPSTKNSKTNSIKQHQSSIILSIKIPEQKLAIAGLLQSWCYYEEDVVAKSTSICKVFDKNCKDVRKK